jgi:outer membrane protein assembly factor BamB
MGRRLLIVAVLVAGIFAAFFAVRAWRDGATAEVNGPPTPSAEMVWAPATDDWPCWRGPDGSNRSAASAPHRWSATDGVRWQAKLPGRGHASVIVCGERLFAISSDEASSTQTLHCLHATTGEQLWQHTTLRGGWMRLHPKNTHASSTPACDGQRVLVAGISDGGLWVTAVGLDGERLWQRRVGPFTSQHGYASSLALYRGLVIVAGENRGSGIGKLTGVTSYLAALTRDTGEVAWLVRRPALPSYGSPAVVGDRVVLAGAKGVSAYDALTGRLDWEHAWEEGRTASAVASGGGRIFVSRTQPSGRVIALPADGPSTPEPIWEQPSASDVPSPLWHEGRVYLLGDQGVLSCLEDTGKQRWKLRLAGNFSASPLLAGGLLYCTNEQGMTFVVQPGDGKGQILARNPLGEATFATPVPVGGRLYFRTESGVACIEAADKLGRAR